MRLGLQGVSCRLEVGFRGKKFRGVGIEGFGEVGGIAFSIEQVEDVGFRYWGCGSGFPQIGAQRLGVFFIKVQWPFLPPWSASVDACTCTSTSQNPRPLFHGPNKTPSDN